MFIEIKIKDGFPEISINSKNDRLKIDPLGCHPQIGQKDTWQLPITKEDEQQILKWFVNHMS